MKHVVSLTIILAMAATTSAQLLDGDMLGLKGDLHGTIGVTWDSKYIWRGFAVYGHKSAVHVVADLNFFETGFGTSVAIHRANSSGFENWERWDYTLYYQGGLAAGEPYTMNYRLGYVYYNYPDRPADNFDLQEIHLILSWPNVLPVKGLCPSYVLVNMWPSRGDSYVEGWRPGENVSGFAHIFMLDYAFTIPGLLPETPEQLIKIHSEAVFNDGISPTGTNVDQGWTNAVFGLSTDFDLGNNLSLTPAVYYQIRMDKSLTFVPGAIPITFGPDPHKSETWASIGLKYTF